MNDRIGASRAELVHSFWQMYAGMRELAKAEHWIIALWSTEQVAGFMKHMSSLEQPRNVAEYLFECNGHWHMLLDHIDRPSANRVFRDEAQAFAVTSLPMAVGEISYEHQGRRMGYWDIAPPAPMNLFRYAVHQRDNLTDTERSRIVEVITGWLLMTEKGHARLLDKPQLRNEELPSQVAMSLANIPEPPKPIHLTARTDAQAAEAAQFLFAEYRLLMHRWCFSFADETARQLIREFRPGKECSFTDSPDSIAAVDPIEHFHDIEEARQQTRRIMAKLTEREQQAMTLKADGLTEAQIAHRMGIGVETANEFIDRARQRATGNRGPSRAYRRLQNRSRKKT